jgi:feruloyl esterase
MNRRMGDHAGDFARLFMVPNMAHCGGGAATTNFAENQLKAITDWVEKDIAPDRIVAANTNNASPYPTGGLFDPRVAMYFPTGGTRPLCPYPRIPAYKGSGMTNDATNFACVDPQFKPGGDHDFHDDDDGRGDDGR